MNGHVRVHMNDDGTALVRTDGQDPTGPVDGLATLRFNELRLATAARSARRCCDARGVYYPIGSEHCACLACEVDKVHRKWRLEKGLPHVVSYTEPASQAQDREPEPGRS